MNSAGNFIPLGLGDAVKGDYILELARGSQELDALLLDARVVPQGDEGCLDGACERRGDDELRREKFSYLHHLK